MANIKDNPTADDKEYLPPTQSQNSKIFEISIPKSPTASLFVETATK